MNKLFSVIVFCFILFFKEAIQLKPLEVCFTLRLVLCYVLK